MSGKIKIVKMLGNPAKKKKTTRRRKAKRNLSRKTASKEQLWILRAIVATGRNSPAYLWWGGSKWTKHRKFAKALSRKEIAHALKVATVKAPTGWLDITALPA